MEIIIDMKNEVVNAINAIKTKAIIKKYLLNFFLRWLPKYSYHWQSHRIVSNESYF